jgi:hypothetical protein
MMKGMGKGLPADQREQGVDEQRDELVDQVAELGADDDRDGELHQVPAHDEVLETAHADRLPVRRKVFVRSHWQQVSRRNWRQCRAACPLTVHRDRLPLSGMRADLVRDEVPLEEGCPLAGSRGHGRDLVAQLSVRWAAGQLPGGKVVWAELPSRQRDPCGSHLLPQEMQRAQRGRSNATSTLVPWGPESVFAWSASFRTSHRP